MIFVTAMDKSRLLDEAPLDSFNFPSADNLIVKIALNPDSSFQEMDGFGYTLTGGSALHLQGMTPGARNSILTELFGKGKGSIGVSYLRIGIGASDLDEYPWTYNDLSADETDPDLDRFSLAYDTLYLVPTLKEILLINPEISIMASPWSPPAWMKDNNDSRGGSLKKEFYPVYARYFVKYITAMADEGIPIEAITIQNEPLHPGNNPSMLMRAEDQSEFIKTHLGPAFRKNNIQTKIIIYDHTADRPDYPISILDDPEARQYVMDPLSIFMAVKLVH
jgi:glucosylceramidase